MKRTRATLTRKIASIRRKFLHIRSERPALFIALMALAFSFGGLVVWGGVTITLSLTPASLEGGLVLHYTFDDGDVSHEEGSITVQEHGEFMGSTTVAFPVGEGNSNYGPYVAHGKQWIFFSNGSGGFVYKTKDLQGGTWSAPSSSYSSYIGQGRYFAITFDGTHFHLLYRAEGDAQYRRFTPNADGTMTAGDVHEIYTNGTWTVDWFNFYITTDYLGRPWVQFVVHDGTNYKPVVMASTATDGTWSTLSGFPYDLHSTSTANTHGDYPSITELGIDKMIFTWRDVINNRISAREWDNGVWGSVENTGLSQASYGRTSTISPAPGEILVNSFTNVAHRATNGTWSDRSPGGMSTQMKNSFSKAGNTVRLWDSSGNDIRYKETSDAGQTWGTLTTFATSTGLEMFSSTSEIDQGYHSVVWATGTNPYVRYAGVDGEFMVGSKLASITDRSGNEKHGTVNGDVITDVGRIGQGADLNGEDGYISSGNIGTNIRSVSFWFKPTALGQGLFTFNGSQSISLSNWYDPSVGVSWYNESWSHRKNITIDNTKVDATLTNFPVYVDLSHLGTDFFSEVRSDGGDIRITEADGATEVPREVVAIDTTGQTGELHFKAPSVSSSADTVFYIYYGNAGATDYATDATYGAENVWTNNYEFVSHDGGLTDSTANGNNSTANGGVTAGGVTGKLGDATHFDASNDFFSNVAVGTLLDGNGAFNVSLWIKSDTIANDRPIFTLETGAYDAGGDDTTILRFDQSGYSAPGTEVLKAGVKSSTGFQVGETTNYATSTDWLLLDIGWTSGGAPQVFRNGTLLGWNFTPSALSGTLIANVFSVGRGNKDGYFDGIIDEVRVSSVERGANWVSVEYENQNNTNTFYTIGAQQSPDDSWSHRKPITIQSSLVEENVTDFPVLIQRTDADWRSVSNGGKVAQANGNDILFTSYAGAKLDHEIEYYDPTTGELRVWVKVSSVSSSEDTDIYIYYGNAEIGSQENATGVWDGNYVGVWHMEEDPSGTAPQMLDSTTNANAGTANGTMTSGDQVAGKIGGSLDFDGSNDVIRVPNSTSTNITGNQFTISAWVYPTDFSPDVGIISKAHEGTNNAERYHLGINGTGTMAIRRYSGSQNFGPSTAALLVNNQWQYIVGRYDGSTLKAYYNGNEVGSTSATGNITSSTLDLVFGKRYDSRFYGGRIDEARVSNIARSNGWIATEYNNQNNPSGFIAVGTEEPYSASNIAVNGLVSPTVYINGSTANTVVTPNTWHHVTVTTSTNINASAVEIGRVGSNYFDGVIDEVRIYSATLSSSDVNRIYRLGATTTINTTLTPPELQVGLVGHWTFDGKHTTATTAEDIAGTSDGTIYGATSTQGRIGQALEFDGVSGTYVNHGNSGGNLTSVGTVSLWVKSHRLYPSDDGNTHFRGIISKTSGGGASTISWWMDWYGTNITRTFRAQLSNGITTQGFTVNNFDFGSDWNHIVYSWDGSLHQLYINGAAAAPVNQTINAQFLDTSLDVGRTFNGDSHVWHGLIDDVRIYNRALPFEEIQRLYRLGATTKINTTLSAQGSADGPISHQGSTAEPVAHWTFDGPTVSETTAEDVTGMHNGTITGATPAPGRIGQGLYFDYTAANGPHYISVPSSTNLNIATVNDSLSVFAWVKNNGECKSSNTTLENEVFLSRYGASSSNNTWWIGCAGTTASIPVAERNKLRLEFFTSTASTVLQSAQNLNDTAWHHIGWKYDGATQSVSLYLDGVSVASSAVNAPSAITSTNPLCIGGYGSTCSGYNGVQTIDDVRIFSRALSDVEIQRLYKLGN